MTLCHHPLLAGPINCRYLARVMWPWGIPRRGGRHGVPIPLRASSALKHFQQERIVTAIPVLLRVHAERVPQSGGSLLRQIAEVRDDPPDKRDARCIRRRRRPRPSRQLQADVRWSRQRRRRGCGVPAPTPDSPDDPRKLLGASPQPDAPPLLHDSPPSPLLHSRRHPRRRMSPVGLVRTTIYDGAAAPCSMSCRMTLR